MCPAPIGHQGSCPTARTKLSISWLIASGGRASFTAKPKSSEQTSKRSLSILCQGKFNDPVRVVAFNTLEHWSEDVSKQIADEIQTQCDIEGVAVPEHVSDFVASHTGPIRQLSLRLA
jgi:hypothetical protein